MPRSPIKARAIGRFPVAMAFALTMALLCVPAKADLPSPFLSGKLEVWFGGEAPRGARGAWMGLNWSPLGKIEDPGFRLRLAAGGGQYRSIDGSTGVSIYGYTTFADLLAGYQWSLGNTTLKLFAGVTSNSQLQLPVDDPRPPIESATGAKIVGEAWINLTPYMFAQIDLSAATVHHAYTSRVRLGYRLTRGLGLGVEASAAGNDDSRNLRAGLFARYEWLGGEISASGGVTDQGASRTSPYGGLVYLTRY